MWESMLSSVRVRAADSTPLKRKLFDVFQRLAERAELRKGEGKKVPPLTRLGPDEQAERVWPGARPR